MNKKTVSALGTVYNNCNIVEESIKSIISGLSLYFEKFEIVIVDNYSTDGTFEKLNDLGYKNLRIIRNHCTRGKGRDIALRNASASYIFPIDLDTIYSPEYFKMLSFVIDNMLEDNTIVESISKRETLLNLGGWKDLNACEDIELNARAVSRGIRWINLPYKFLKNEESKGSREKRYAKGFSYIKRVVINKIHKIRGTGTDKFYKINCRTKRERLLMMILLVIIKILNYPIYSYSEYNNWDFVSFKNSYQTLNEIKLNKDIMVVSLYKHNYSSNALKQIENKMMKIGYMERTEDRDFVTFRIPA
ncbi:glycosyltransferase [Cuniculiplasma sp. SKW3]|uniref:glycosyltransferase n=1 Tax=Cuniculiplasma sp. SKW3 TaxID=3400170 RepID=UPI003FD221EB